MIDSALSSIQATFQGQIQKFDHLYGCNYIEVPAEVALPFPPRESGPPRVHVELPGAESFPGALNHQEGIYWVPIHPHARKKLRLQVGMSVDVTLTLDTSEIGFTMTDELLAVLDSDPVADALFQLMKPGMKRSLLRYISDGKTEATRIKRSLLLTDRLLKEFALHQNGHPPVASKAYLPKDVEQRLTEISNE